MVFNIDVDLYDESVWCANQSQLCNNVYGFILDQTQFLNMISVGICVCMYVCIFYFLGFNEDLSLISVVYHLN